MKRLILCDMDGTLANNEQRAHLLPSKYDCATTDKWERFNNACDKDLPIEQGFILLANLCIADSVEHTRWALWSGRVDAVAEKSRIWFLVEASKLYKNHVYSTVISHSLKKSYFRPLEDHRAASICKTDLAKQAVSDAGLEEGDELILIDDDLEVLQECREFFPAATCVWIGNSHCKALANGVQTK